jgi:hypothetical protein
MKTKNSFIVMLNIFFLAACTDTGSLPKSDFNALVPLAIGNNWTYEYTQYKEDGSISSSSQIIESIDSIKSIAGGDFFLMTDYHGGDFLFRNVGNRIVEAYNGFKVVPFFRILTQDGAKYYTDVWDMGNCNGEVAYYGFTGNYDILSYDCIKDVQINWRCDKTISTKWVYYIKQGIGIIRVEKYVENASGDSYLYSTQDLKSYDLQ